MRILIFLQVYLPHLSGLETEVMDFLAELGTDFDQQTTFIKMELFHNSWYTTTPLKMAIKAGHVELVKALIQKGCKVNQQHLQLAYQRKKTECARILQMKLLSAETVVADNISKYMMMKNISS